MERIQLASGDITQLEVDIVVNAANSSLLGGGGVDGAIHRVAGPELRELCGTLGGCQTGEAKITPGFLLKASQIIHTVGPVWRGGEQNEAEQLANCYRACLDLAEENQAASIAFPAISTGAYGFPSDLAAKIAVDEVTDWLASHELPDSVTFVYFNAHTEAAYQKVLNPN